MDKSLAEYIAMANVKCEKQKSSQQKMSTDAGNQLSNGRANLQATNELEILDEDIQEDINQMYQELSECKTKTTIKTKRERIMPPQPSNEQKNQQNSNNNNKQNKNNNNQRNNNNNNGKNKNNNYHNQQQNNNKRFRPYQQQQQNNFNNNNNNNHSQQQQRSHFNNITENQNDDVNNFNNLSQILLSNIQQQLQQRQGMFNSYANSINSNLNQNGIGQLSNLNGINGLPSASAGLLAGQQIVRSINLVQLSNGCWYIGQNGLYAQANHNMNAALNFPCFGNNNNNNNNLMSISNLNNGAGIPMQNIIGLNNHNVGGGGVNGGGLGIGIELLSSNNNANMNNAMNAQVAQSAAPTAVSTSNSNQARPQRRSLGSLLGHRPNEALTPDLIDLALKLITKKVDINENGNN